MADNVAITAGSGTTIATDDVGGVQYQRVKVCFGADASASDAQIADPLPVFPADTARTIVHYWANGVASGTTGTETAITLTKSASPGGATSSAASHVVTSGKRFRITSIVFASRGHSTATAQVTTFNLRVNTAGAVTTTSNVWLSGRTATPATALAWDRLSIQFGDIGPEVLGDGTLQIGMTAAATFTTNAPTWDVQIVGYEW